MIKASRLTKIKELLKAYPFFELLGSGKRGVVYRISPALVVKIERDDIRTFNVIKNEYDVLKIIGKYEYFPRAVLYNEELRYLIREYVNGELIGDALSKKVLRKALEMCYTLDKEGFNQQELTNPFKHIYVNDNKVMMIDFERGRKTNNPKNVSQFTQYISKKYNIKSRELIKLVQAYKQSFSRKDFEKVLSFFVKINLIY